MKGQLLLRALEVWPAALPFSLGNVFSAMHVLFDFDGHFFSPPWIQEVLDVMMVVVLVQQ